MLSELEYWYLEPGSKRRSLSFMYERSFSGGGAFPIPKRGSLAYSGRPLEWLRSCRSVISRHPFGCFGSTSPIVSLRERAPLLTGERSGAAECLGRTGDAHAIVDADGSSRAQVRNPGGVYLPHLVALCTTAMTPCGPPGMETSSSSVRSSAASRPADNR